MNEWQPIETAPKDGSWFLIANFHEHANEDGEYEVARYRPYHWDKFVEQPDGRYLREQVLVRDWDANNFHRATHWAPIPEPPK